MASELTPAALASILAHVEHFGAGATSEIVRRLGHDVGAFEAARVQVPTRMAQAARKGDMAPTLAFGEAFQSAQRELEAKRPALRDLGPDPLEAPRAAPIAPAPSPVGASVDDIVARVAGALGVSPDATIDASELPPESLPFGQNAEGAAPYYVRAAPPSSRAAPRSGATVDPSSIPVIAPTPFEQRALDSWTVERYVAYLRERRLRGADAARGRYGFANAAEEAALFGHFTRRFQADPALEQRWRALMLEQVKGPSS